MVKSKVAILVMRNNELKLLLPLIQEMLLSETMAPLLITSKVINSGKKKSLNYDEGLNPFHDRMEVHYVDRPDEAVSVMLEHAVAILLMANPWISTGSVRKLKEKGIRVIYLQHSTDIIATWPQTHDLEYFKLWDGFLCFSQYWKDGMLREIRNHIGVSDQDAVEIEDRMHPVGMPELDQTAVFDKEEILAKYGLPANRKIVFFDPVGYVNSVPNFFYKYYFCSFDSSKDGAKRILKNLLLDVKGSPGAVWKFPFYTAKILNSRQRISNYKNLFQRIRNICSDHDYLLICKSREKNDDPDFVKAGCDLFTYDRGYLPFTLLELLFISDTYIGFNSSAVMEAVHCNLPVVCFHVFPTYFQFGDYGGNVYQFIEECFNTENEWLNYQGVSRIYSWDRPETDLAGFITDFKINPQSRREYMEKFLGCNGATSSRRVLNILENHYL